VTCSDPDAPNTIATLALRVLHFLPSLDPERGGPVRAVLDLSHGLRSRGHRVTLLASELGEKPAPGGPAITKLDGGVVLNNPLSGPQKRQIAALLASHDLVHVHGVWNYCNVQIGRVARAAGKPYFVSLRGMLDDWCMAQKVLKKRVFLAACGRAHLERARAVHCTAGLELEQSRKWFPKGRGVVVPNVLMLDPYRTLPGAEKARAKFPMLANGRPNVLFLSRLHVKKGAEVFLEACAALRDKGVACNAVLAGSGEAAYEQELRAIAARLGIEDRVLFTGHVGGETKISLYQAATCLALPTHQENFGFVFPECLAAGTPVITTRGVDIWPELEKGGATMIVDRTPGAFAEAIARVIQEVGLHARLAAASRPFVFAEYDEARLLGMYEAMYGGA
jgi:glycosyltransferase involved in cell wall biosynthesis